jgi:heterotetrameric sarcosine oxidase gamma subunit
VRDSAFPSGTSAFSGLLPEPGRCAGNEAVWACERRHCATATMITRRGRFSELQHKVAAGCGVTLNDGPKRSAAGALGFVGTAPLQWLAVHDDATPGWPRQLAELLDGAASVSDQSGGQVVLRLGGAGAHALLSRAVFVDLHPWSFGPDDAATTVVAQVGITIWQRADVRAYELAFARSYAESMAHWLQLNAVALVSEG